MEAVSYKFTGLYTIGNRDIILAEALPVPGGGTILNCIVTAKADAPIANAAKISLELLRSPPVNSEPVTLNGAGLNDDSKENLINIDDTLRTTNINTYVDVVYGLRVRLRGGADVDEGINVSIIFNYLGQDV